MYSVMDSLSHVEVTNAEYTNGNFDFYKMTWHRNILEESYPMSNVPKIYKYKSPCLRNMKPST